MKTQAKRSLGISGLVLGLILGTTATAQDVVWRYGHMNAPNSVAGLEA
ncbi:hypothetical protein [Roseinatronobacter sp. S2]|nr:hypothetical protein [Roseinatronobacter sp. S2]